MTRRPFSVVAMSLLLAALTSQAVTSRAAAESYVKIQKKDEGRYDVTFGGELFTTLHTQEHPKPILYPIIGPHGIRMTRDYPMKDGTPDEARDHKHHQSLWFTHGAVNGVDFWALGKGKIVTTKVDDPVDSGSEASIVLHDKWVDPEGKTVCTDTQKLTFHKAVVVNGNDVTALDYEITIHASEGNITFGDTKEGTMAIRTHPKLRIDKGAKAINSEGVTGGDVWGKRAKWVDYSAEVEGKSVGVSIFDHPSNPRYPTWWHARNYGLIAANPFGIHDFEKKPAGEGDLKVEEGKSITFKYRFLFHEGDADGAKVAECFSKWAK